MRELTSAVRRGDGSGYGLRGSGKALETTLCEVAYIVERLNS